MQARLSSQRTPRKMVKSFAGSSLVDIACKKIVSSKIIPKENFYFSAYEKEIIDIVKANNLQIFYRSKESAKAEGPMQKIMEYHDKLDFKYSVVISACCPLLKIETIDSFVEAYLKSSHNGLFSVIPKKNYFWKGDNFGNGVGIYGNMAVVGAYNRTYQYVFGSFTIKKDNSGMVYLYKYNNSVIRRCTVVVV